jgi:hypothetical protein
MRIRGNGSATSRELGVASSRPHPEERGVARVSKDEGKERPGKAQHTLRANAVVTNGGCGGGAQTPASLYFPCY